MHFMMRAKALVAFPGGFGTLDELFEVITLVQTRKAKQVPIVLFGSDYWKRLINFDVLVDEGVISPDDLELFQYADDPQDAWDVDQALLRALRLAGAAPQPPTARCPRHHAADDPEHAGDADQRAGRAEQHRHRHARRVDAPSAAGPAPRRGGAAA